MTEFQEALVKHLQTPGSELWLYIEEGWTTLTSTDNITLSDSYDIIRLIPPKHIPYWGAWLDGNLYMGKDKVTHVPRFNCPIESYSIGPPEN